MEAQQTVQNYTPQPLILQPSERKESTTKLTRKAPHNFIKGIVRHIQFSFLCYFFFWRISCTNTLYFNHFCPAVSYVQIFPQLPFKLTTSHTPPPTSVKHCSYVCVFKVHPVRLDNLTEIPSLEKSYSPPLGSHDCSYFLIQEQRL